MMGVPVRGEVRRGFDEKGTVSVYHNKKSPDGVAKPSRDVRVRAHP